MASEKSSFDFWLTELLRSLGDTEEADNDPKWAMLPTDKTWAVQLQDRTDVSPWVEDDSFVITVARDVRSSALRKAEKLQEIIEDLPSYLMILDSSINTMTVSHEGQPPYWCYRVGFTVRIRRGVDWQTIPKEARR